jgi:hypothetical protein
MRSKHGEELFRPLYFRLGSLQDIEKLVDLRSFKLNIGGI